MSRKKECSADRDTVQKVIGITIRIDEDLNRRFSGILALHNETATGFLRECIEKYVAENYQSAIEILDIQREQNP